MTAVTPVKLAALTRDWRTWASGLLVVMAGAAVTPAHAQLRVDISGVGATQYPIAIADFAGDAKGDAVAEVIRADLTRSGQFQLVNATGANLDVNSSIDYDQWRNRGADYLAYGSITQSGGQYSVSYKLVDSQGRQQMDGVAFSGTEKELRRVSHQIADRIYEKITGVRGVFSTRIAYVLQTGNTYELQIADADGQNPQVMLRSKQSIISPSWSPDGKRLAYVSFELNKPVVYVQTLASGQRVPLANFKGNNSAPSWAPNGQQLALVLSRDGISQIYTISADGSGLRRVMRSPLIDTEPQFTPDGGSLIFTSDRGGNPQIYKVPLSGGNAQRITFNGSYNISPAISPDGNKLVYVTKRDGAFRIALQDMASGSEQLLTNGPDDQSPSFAPNGMQILYSSVQGGRSVLAVTSVDGRVRQTLSALNGKVREPTWGPFTN
ncbi:Tol-Pal system beta propeller repeat protein TolB [Pusillimonas sp. ANT_WB101]|uniref:Tol-Pal system beta propeller repeat protein TolB n=1 Tax=Pusillimonas sp. ANT_WB101 TaxID=2597356 RepID=UPI0011EC6CE7|nr:Tol-Pal system beta propeller repeat protein TolB [Pusillimonas sp. ANT_WB101]KAA0890581.1 Tol-Pal system protein TolB [Pusillimonas sp. ANT_WB101]NYT75391.1 Tol-Pal system protein TolB [Alcaligenaceae bacterium]